MVIFFSFSFLAISESFFFDFISEIISLAFLFCSEERSKIVVSFLVALVSAKISLAFLADFFLVFLFLALENLLVLTFSDFDTIFPKLVLPVVLAEPFLLLMFVEF